MNEKKKAQKLRFYNAGKIDNYNREGKKGKQIQKNLKNMSKHKNNKCFFFSHCCQSPFHHWESQFTSLP